MNRPLSGEDQSALEVIVMVETIHAVEGYFVRLSPFSLIAALVGLVLTQKKAEIERGPRLFAGGLSRVLCVLSPTDDGGPQKRAQPGVCLS